MYIIITIQSRINMDLLSDQCNFCNKNSLVCVELEDVKFTLTDRTDGVVGHPGVVSRPGLVAPVLPSPLRDQPGNKLRE